MYIKDKIVNNSSTTGVSYLPVEAPGKPIRIVANEAIFDTLEWGAIQQGINTRLAPGVKDVILNPDAHFGHSVPVGSVVVTEDVIYPAPVGVDICCSMSFLQLELPASEIRGKEIRREILNSIIKRISNGKASEKIDNYFWRQLLINPPRENDYHNMDFLGIPKSWAQNLETSFYGSHDLLDSRFEVLRRLFRDNDGSEATMLKKLNQLGSIGGGNHLLEIIEVFKENNTEEFDSFGLKKGNVGALSHFGSRGFGHLLSTNQTSVLQNKFKKWHIPFPSEDKGLIYAPIESKEGQDYLADIYLAANFAIWNHLLVNKNILDAFREVIPGVNGELVYHVSHNMVQEEIVDNKKCLVGRKGATRAYPAKHFALKGTKFYDTGHPVLLPGNVIDGSFIMVGQEGAKETAYSINHGAGRTKSRRAAKASITQETVDRQLAEADIVSNHGVYPIDESKGAYKDFIEVIASVEKANLAKKVAYLKPLASIKDVE